MSEDRSGWNKVWAASLSDMLATENVPRMLAFFLELEEMPLRTCQAARRCANPVEWWVAFHGCYSGTVCDHHLKSWVWDVNAYVAAGGAKCEDCGNTFGALPLVMTWRII